MSLSAKIIAPMIFLIALYVINTLYHAQRLEEALAKLSAARSTLSSLPGSFREVIREAEVVYANLSRDEPLGSRSHARRLSLQLASLSARLSESLIRLDSLQSPSRVEAIKRDAQSIYATYVQLEGLLAKRAQASRAETEDVAEGDRLSARWLDWTKELTSLRVKLSQLSEDEIHEQVRLEDEARAQAMMFSSISLMLGLMYLIYVSRLMRPLRVLTQGVNRFGSGDYSHRIRASGSHEFSRLAVALNNMGAAIVQRDEQLLSEQQRRLQEASLTAAGRLSAQITHELRNPLSSIGLNSELLAEELIELGLEPARTEELQNLLSEITREIERLRGITEEYLRYARIPPPELARVDLNTLCLEITEFYRAEAERSGVQLILDLDPLPRPASVDANLIRSALLNLIRNACEAIEGGPSSPVDERLDRPSDSGIVLITTRTGGREARITILDSGPGIAPEQRERVFEPFFSTKPQGTGLGLSMVRQLIQAQRGRVTLETPIGSDEARVRSHRAHELTGASVSLYLPLAPFAEG